MRRPDHSLPIVLGAILGALVAAFVGSFGQLAQASRNSSGTYSLYTPGNPVVSGTTISSSWANSTLSDIQTEITNSLDRSGRGGMLAPLQLYDGTVSAPGLTFVTDTDSGLYRIGANDLAMAVNGVKTQEWATTGAILPRGLVVTQAQADTASIVCTGNGSGAGVNATGGASNGAGGTFTGGATNGVGVFGQGTGSGVGGQFIGGATGKGLTGTGSGTAVGGEFANGTAATGGTRQNAAKLTNGDLDLSAVTDATSTTAISDRLTPTNIIKAWASITITNANPYVPSVLDGFNVTSVTRASATQLTVTFASAMANANYVVNGTASVGNYWVATAIGGKATGSVNISLVTTTGSVTLDSLGTPTIDITVIGRQ